MDCPKCGTWNPDDKIRCWRCGVELPKIEEPKKTRPIPPQVWLWGVAILMALLTLLSQCDALRIGDPGDSVGLLADSLRGWALL